MVGSQEIVTVWLLPVADGPAGLLDERERTRAGALRRPEDRLRYVAAHRARRLAVAGVLGLDPADLRFAAHPCPLCGDPHGRPFAEQDPSLHLSLSHTTDLVAIAASRLVVGIDVEWRHGRTTRDDLLVALHPHEAEASPDRDDALRTWVRKEAYLKGLGTGLGLDPSTVDLRTDPRGWWVADLDAGDDHLAALAVETEGPCAVEIRLALPA